MPPNELAWPLPSSLSSSTNSFAAQIEHLRHLNNETAAFFHAATPFIDANQRVNVVVRKRPATNDVDMLHVLPPDRVLVYQPRTRVDLRREITTVKFRFDAVLDEGVSNETVYEFAVQPLVPTLLEGQNATVFCFGQTNSGKTHTLLGKYVRSEQSLDLGDDDEQQENNRASNSRVLQEPGLYYLAARDIFETLGGLDDFSVSVSLLELYDRKVLDLLNERAVVPCWEDGAGKVQFPGLSLHPVSDADQLRELVERGHSVRSIGTTSKNSESSRSHAVLQMHINQSTIHHRQREQRRFATMTFIDLGTWNGAR
jgi:kinesin family protein 2/24